MTTQIEFLCLEPQSRQGCQLAVDAGLARTRWVAVHRVTNDSGLHRAADEPH